MGAPVSTKPFAIRGRIALCGLLVTAAPLAQDPVTIEVRVDPRIELMSLVFRLAGNPEYNQARIEAHAGAADAHFAGFRNHPAVQRARAMRRSFGVSFDAVMSMAIHLPGLDDVQGAVSPRPRALDSRWNPAATEEFLDALQDFVDASRFEEFFAAQRDLYRLTEQRLRAVLEDGIRMEWFGDFFGTRPRASFTVIPGLLNGGGSYGPRVLHADGREDLFSILGVWQSDAEGLPVFDPGIVDTVVHEFCHSFCNRIVDAHLDSLRVPAAQIWPHVADIMDDQAYGSWEIMMKESLVRASTARYVAATRGDEEHARSVAYQQSRGFEWTGELSDLLARYEGQRDRYPTLDRFFPEIADFFAAYAVGFARTEAQRPRVVELRPENGAADVDPALDAIVVTFDREMRDGSWSVVGGGPEFPELAGEVHYDDQRRVLTIPVRLKPGWSYELWLNRGRYDGFRSVGGLALRPVRIAFRTR